MHFFYTIRNTVLHESVKVHVKTRKERMYMAYVKIEIKNLSKHYEDTSKGKRKKRCGREESN